MKPDERFKYDPLYISLFKLFKYLNKKIGSGSGDGDGDDYFSSEYDYIIEREGAQVIARPYGGLPVLTGSNISDVIEASVNQLTNGGVIFIRGNHTDARITNILRDNITIKGQGMYSNSISFKNNADQYYNPALRVLYAMFEIHGRKNVKICDITLDGNGQNQMWVNTGNQVDGPGSLSAVFVGEPSRTNVNSENVIIEKVFIQNFTQYGVYTGNRSFRTKVIDCVVADCYWNGLTLEGVEEEVINTETYGSGDVGITMYGSRTTLLKCKVGPQDGTYSSISSKWGIAFEPSFQRSREHRIIDCEIDGGVNYDMERALGLQNADDIYIQNLKVRNVRNFGAWIQGSKRNKLVNCDFKSDYTGYFTQGIVIDEFTREGVTTFSTDNQIINTNVDFYGTRIRISGAGQSKNLLLGNFLKGELDQDIVNNGTNTVRRDNFSIGLNQFLEQELNASQLEKVNIGGFEVTQIKESYLNDFVTAWATDNGVDFTPPPPVEELLTIKATSRPVTKTGTIYTPTTDNGDWGNTILWNKRLVGDGWVQMIPNIVKKDGMVSFSTSNDAGANYNSFAVSLVITYADAGVFVVQVNGVDTNFAPSSKIRLAREGSTLKVYENLAGTLTLKRTITGTFNGTLYPVSDMKGNSQVDTPTGLGLIV